MTEEQETVLMIKGMIASLPPATQEQCEEMVEHLRRMVSDAGDVVGPMAIALVGAELDAQ